MSTEQPIDPDLVEQTKQQIRNLVREIAQISRTDISPVDYYDALLTRVVSALAAVGGAIWTVGDGGGSSSDAPNSDALQTEIAQCDPNIVDCGLQAEVAQEAGVLDGPHAEVAQEAGGFDSPQTEVAQEAGGGG